MKVKEIERTANVAWSPAAHHPILMATATAAQQLDATFNTAAALEIFSLNLEESGQKMSLIGSIPLEYRFHKTAWGAYGLAGSESASGVVVGGADGGNLLMYDPDKLIRGEEALICQKAKHTGTVRAVDFNPFQMNLLASGASESEIFIWDLNNPSAPMTPGAKSQPADDVSCLSWNRQVQHILASTFASRCIVWDLRKNEPIIKVNDGTSNLRCRVVAWHPDVATQLCLASEDEHAPLIQLWDLRFATSPLKCLERHQRGVLSLAWCQQDSDLLLSCGKDDRILCWNPSSNVSGGEVVCEVAVANQWNFDIAWCPRNPAVISSSSFDGHVSVYSLLGGAGQQALSSRQISDSFPGSEIYREPVIESRTVDAAYVLKKPPKWMRRPVGASFGFGGKFVTFESVPATSQRPSAVTYNIYLSQVYTEPMLVERARELETALQSAQLVEFCRKKVGQVCDGEESDKQIWKFLEASFADDPRTEYLKLLDHNPQIVTKSRIINDANVNATLQSNDGLADSQDELSFGGKDSDVFDELSKATVDRRQVPIPNKEDVDGRISRALLVGRVEEAVELCLEHDLMADAILLAMTAGEELLARTKAKYFKAAESDLSRIIAAVVNRDWMRIIQNCAVDNWKEALAGAITYGGVEDFPVLCETLGSRLESENGGVNRKYALPCYICSGNVEKLTECYVKCYADTSSPDALQDFVEVAIVLASSVRKMRAKNVDLSSGTLGNKLCRYAELLASQGSLNAALAYLGNNPDGEMAALLNRLYVAAGTAPAAPTSVANHARRESHEIPKPSFSPGVQLRQSVPATAAYPTDRYKDPAGLPQPSNVQPARQIHTDQSNIYARGGHLSQRYPAQPIQDPTMYAHPAYPSPSYNQQPNPVTKQPTYPNIAPNFPPRSGINQWESENVPGHFPPTPNQQYNYRQPTPPPAVAPMPVPRVEQPGWNDPPQIKHQSRVKSEVEYAAPITQPLFMPGVVPATNPYEHQHYEPQHVSQHLPQPQHQPEYTLPESASHGHINVARPEVAAVAPQVRKGPIPEEHRVLRDVFEDLKNRCVAASANPQIKRKLDDVAKRLETLYDKLTTDGLSPNMVLGLHRIAQVVGQDDYEGALHVHAQMVSAGTFAEIGAFMPGLKVLLQTAKHLGIAGFAH